jgi:hypothetical protein
MKSLRSVSLYTIEVRISMKNWIMLGEVRTRTPETAMGYR